MKSTIEHKPSPEAWVMAFTVIDRHALLRGQAEAHERAAADFRAQLAELDKPGPEGAGL